MEFIRNWLRQLCCYLIVSILLEQLIPKKEYEKPVHLFLNLLLILLLLQPISGKSLNQLWDMNFPVLSENMWSEGRETELQLESWQEKMEAESTGEILEEAIGPVLELQGYVLVSCKGVYAEDHELREIQVSVRKKDQTKAVWGTEQPEKKTLENTLEAMLSEYLKSTCQISVSIQENIMQN